MAKFESGVKAYVPALAIVQNYFPIDHNDREYCCCEECFYYREASKTCGLNHKPVLFPGRYVGDYCPLQRVTEEQHEKLIKAFAEILEVENEQRI